MVCCFLRTKNWSRAAISSTGINNCNSIKKKKRNQTFERELPSFTSFLFFCGFRTADLIFSLRHQVRLLQKPIQYKNGVHEMKPSKEMSSKTNKQKQQPRTPSMRFFFFFLRNFMGDLGKTSCRRRNMPATCSKRAVYCRRRGAPWRVLKGATQSQEPRHGPCAW